MAKSLRVADDSIDGVKREISIAWWQLLLLVARAVGLMAVLALHWGMDRAIKLLMPDFPRWAGFLEIDFMACFSLAYVHLAWDIVTVFAPWWRRAPKAIIERMS
jgi:hypothetical protein